MIGKDTARRDESSEKANYGSSRGTIPAVLSTEISVVYSVVAFAEVNSITWSVNVDVSLSVVRDRYVVTPISNQHPLTNRPLLKLSFFLF